MAELNLAYAKVRTPERRELYDRERKLQRVAPVAVVTPYEPAGRRPAGAEPAVNVIDFGRYVGWTITQIARHDPDYLRWLSRHSSGIRYRRAIEVALREAAGPSAMERVRGKR